jgi:ATP synthase protein I
LTGSGRAFELAFEAGLSVLFGVVVGYYLDRWLDTEPIFLLVFMALGFAASVRILLSIRTPPAGPDRGPPK